MCIMIVVYVEANTKDRGLGLGPDRVIIRASSFLPRVDLGILLAVLSEDANQL
jgi:hypothetical protein